MDLAQMKTRLGLDRWKITIRSGQFDASYGEAAYVRFRQDELEADIYVDPSVQGGPGYERLIVHELLHILMTDLEFTASNGRSVDVMEIYNREQERVINVLADALMS